MAISIVQNNEDHISDNTVVFVAGPFTSTSAGNLLIVCIENFGTRTVVSVTDDASGGSNTYVQATSAAAASGIHGSDIWYCLSAAHAGTANITVTYSGSVGSSYFKGVFLYEVSGFLSCTFDLANHVSGGGSGTTDVGPSLTTTGTTGFVVGLDASFPGVSLNPNTGNEFTSGGLIEGANQTAVCSLISSTAAAHQPIWGTLGTVSNQCISAAAFKDATAAIIVDEPWTVTFPAAVDPTVTVWQ